MILIFLNLLDYINLKFFNFQSFPLLRPVYFGHILLSFDILFLKLLVLF